jgi:hypothetical protein
VGLSLALNLWFGAALVGGGDRAAAEIAARAAGEAAGRTAVTPTSPAIDPKLWASLQTDDLPDLVARLRAAGFPKDVVRAIMAGLIGEQFAARRRALDPDEASRAFWKDRSPDPRHQLAQFQLYREQEQALRTLLGADTASTDPMTQARFRARFGALPPEKLDAVRQLVEDFDRKRLELYYNTGTLNPADTGRLDRELRTALAGLLTPAELEDYDLRNSNTGRSLRNELVAFNPTEAEFRAIFKVRQAFDEQFNFSYTGVPSQELMARQSDARRQMLDQIKAQLGAERGAEYERATNSAYRQTSQLVARLELPADTTMKLWQVQQEFQQRSQTLARSVRSPEQRAALAPQLATLQQEALAKVTPLLGSANAVEAYKQYGGGWINQLAPRPPPAPPRN